MDLKGDSAGCVLYRSGKGGRPLGVVMQRSALWSGGFGLGDRAKERSEERVGEERIGETRRERRGCRLCGGAGVGLQRQRRGVWRCFGRWGEEDVW